MFVVALLLGFGGHALADPVSRFQVEAGYSLYLDTDNVSGPTGIAMLSQEQRASTTVKYMVTELRGGIKSVLENGEALSFANAPGMYVPDKELPDLGGEIGQIGACLSPVGNELFVTSVTSVGATRINRIQVWKSRVAGLWHHGELVREQTKLFMKSPTNNPHQIGYCIFDQSGHLIVGTGDGAHHRTAHLPDYPNGKILRMTGTFDAVAENPFFSEDSSGDVSAFVLASGLRNPFSIAQGEDGVIYVADNGPNVDRLIALEAGRDYPWDNTNESFTYGNILTWPKSIGPSGMVYVPKGHPGLPALEGHLVVAGSYERSIYAIPVSNGEVLGPSKRILAKASEQGGALTGLALGDDGLYLAYMEISRERGFAGSAILRLVGDEGAQGSMELTGGYLFDQKGCRGCHMLKGSGSPIGPALDNVVARIRSRLTDADYISKLESRASAIPESAMGFMSGALNDSENMEQRISDFMQLKMLAPEVDTPKSGMAVLELSAAERNKIVGYLMGVGSLDKRAHVKEDDWNERLKWFLKQRSEVTLALVLVLGLLIGYFVGRRRSV